MDTPSPLNEREQADLVAYLDGELAGDAARAMETRLSLDPAVRAEAEALKRTWELLDFLPRPEPSATFTNRTLEKLPPVSASGPSSWLGWGPRLFGLVWAASLLLGVVAGYAGYNLLVSREPGDKELVRDLRLIENKRYYEAVEDVEFLRELDRPDLFGEDPADS
jgi:anti-sigma factor RsiW